MAPCHNLTHKLAFLLDERDLSLFLHLHRKQRSSMDEVTSTKSFSSRSSRKPTDMLDSCWSTCDSPLSSFHPPSLQRNRSIEALNTQRTDESSPSLCVLSSQQTIVQSEYVQRQAAAGSHYIGQTLSNFTGESLSPWNHPRQ